MTQRVLHVIPDLRHGRTTRQLALLTAHLPRDRFESRVVVLGSDGPARSQFTAASVDIETLEWKRALDFRPLWRLRQRIQEFRPNVIHAWHPAALRAITVVRPPNTAVLLSRPCSELMPAPFARGLIRAAYAVAVMDEREARHCRDLGVPEACMRRVRVAAACRPMARDVMLRTLPRVFQPGARFLACVGPLERRKRPKDAVWAFAILHYLYNDLHLLMIGSGPEAECVQRYARHFGIAERVHLLGNRSDVPELLGLCDALWLPAQAGGAGVIVEALAAGCPAVAVRRPETVQLLGASEAGVLVPAHAPAELVHQTRLLLDDAARRSRLAEAGRQHAARHNAVPDMVRDYESIYARMRESAVPLPRRSVR